ncbi:unnamed protein product, partial [marine sediment metagenome]
MQTKQKIALFGIVILTIGILASAEFHFNNVNNNHYNVEQSLHSSAQQYRNDLDSIFIGKITDYSTMGYFPQIYEPSLQATYYALAIYDALDSLDQINSNELLDYIL